MSTRLKRSRRWNHFRPLLESLESRWCPAVSMSVEAGHILHVVGDRGDNLVEVTMQGFLVSVTGDGTRQEFRGIDMIDINTWAGRDSVQIDALDLPTGSDCSVDVDLGAGSDEFNLAVENPTAPAPESNLQGCIDVAVLGGAGDDRVSMVVGNQIVGDVEFSADLGDGNDVFALSCPSDPSLPPPTAGNLGSVGVSIDGGAGNDLMEAVIGSPGEQAGKRGGIFTELKQRAQGGAGNDTFVTNFTNAKLNAPISLDDSGGLGNDTFRSTFADTDIDAPLSLSNDGGAGHDDIRLIFGFNPQPNPPEIPGVTINAAVDVTLDGGMGPDNIAAICGFNPQSGPSSIPAFEVASEFQLDVLGGGGSDLANLRVLNSQIDGSLGVMADLGAGNDQLHVETTDDNVAGKLTAQFRLGDGSDVMGPLNHDVTVSGEVAIGVDCGGGNDMIQGEMMPSVEAGGSYDLAIAGGAGNDAIAISLLPAVQRGGTYRAAIDGGLGNDRLFGLVTPGASEPSSLIDVSFLGGDGNDQIAVATDMTNFTSDSGKLSVAINCGIGADQTLFLVRGIEGPMDNAAFLLDGGIGRDSALISPLVQVQNVELIDYI